MPDFAQLFRKPAGGSTRPTLLPTGDYPAIIVGYEGILNERFNPKMYQVRVNVRLQGWPEGLDSSQVPVGVDVTKKQFRKDYDYQDESGNDAERLYQLRALFESLGIVTSGRNFDECLPELHGKAVIASLSTYKDNKPGGTGEPVGNDVSKIIGMR